MDFWLLSDSFLSLLTLIFLEVVLGIDNLIFISISTSQMPVESQAFVRRFGLLFAMITRLILLFCIFSLSKMMHPIVQIYTLPLSVRDILLLLGGVFLIYKSTNEMHNDVLKEQPARTLGTQSILWVILQIGLLDIVFSFDSVITAVGMTNQLWIMSFAIVFAIIIMIFLSEMMTRFIQQNPTIKMLALCFLLMIGMVLIADGMHFVVPRGYLYFAISFSLFVETMNILVRRSRTSKP